MTARSEIQTPLPPERAYGMVELVLALEANRIDAAGQTKIISALTMASTLHASEHRESGAPFVQHPLAAALYLLRVGYKDVPTLVGVLSHDIPEDTWAFGNPKTISHEQWMSNIKLGFTEGFDAQTAEIVIALQRPKVNKIDVYSKEQADALFAGKLEDGPVEAVMAKLAERLHNARTLEYLSVDRQMAIVEETEKVLYPIFERAVKAFPDQAKSLMNELQKALDKAKASWIAAPNPSPEAGEL